MRKSRLVLSVIFLGCFISSVRGTEKKANAFQHAEYMQSTASGQKKAVPAIKGTLSFDSDTKSIDFLDQKGAQAFSIKYEPSKLCSTNVHPSRAMRK